jgi:hypothetical protein
VVKSKNVERKAKIEQLRREQQRKERRRSLAILGACGVVVLGLLLAAVIPYVQHQHQIAKTKGEALSKIGVSQAAAGCAPVKTRSAQGSGQHIPAPTVINYPDAPPAFGKHWPNYLQPSELRTFYTRSDAPQIERMVHSLEHGHTILWYDDTIKEGSADYQAIQAMGKKLGLDSYFIAAPYITKDDGGRFPAGKHIALTHWTGGSSQKGVWEYCTKASGAVTQKFMDAYPKTNAPEAGAT